MATKPGAFSEWPWERLGNFKYVLYLPLVASAIHNNFLGGTDVQNFSFHILVIAALRYFQGQLWMTVTRLHDLVGKHRIQERSMQFEQLDRERSWEDFILFQALLIYGYNELSLFQIHPLWNWKGFILTIFWHIGPVEFIYYWFHRLLHHHYLFRRYHSHHHSSFLTQAVTGNVHPFAEHFAYAWLFGSTFIFNSFVGTGSIALLYAYTIWFDFMNYIGHCNWEFMPTRLFRAFPPLKYLVYTPSFHSLHHTQVHTNFCLFVPIYDYLYGTVDKSSDSLHLTARQGRAEKLDVVFLTHPTDLLSIFHFSVGVPSFAARPYARRWYIWLLYPVALPIMLLLWAFGVPFTVDQNTIDKLSIRIWAIPRFDFHYGLASEKPKINRLIEESIVEAQNRGAKVICLGMHNKDELLNANGALFVKNNDNLRISIVDGSTLATSIVVNKLPKDVSEVLLVGAESSKVGRAIAIYLCCRRGVTVKVLNPSAAAGVFEAVKKSVPEELQHKLIRLTSLEEGRQCKTWIVGEPLLLPQQLYAPSGTCFYQFTDVDSMEESRGDCSYAKLPAMHLPPGFKGLRACEGRMPRGVVQASHAAGILHAMEGWNHHEVGNWVDIDRIELVLKAALDHGFVPYY